MAASPLLGNVRPVRPGLTIFQVSREVVCLVGGLCQGWLWARQYQRDRREDWAHTGCSVETRVMLECEREYQEHLLLSVMPAYIAAEVRLSPGSKPVWKSFLF